MTASLPGGGKAWFERRRKVRPFGTTRLQLTPCSTEGWLVIAVYIAVTALGVFILLPEATAVRLMVWGTLEAVATVLLIVIAFRMSPPEWRDK